ncbi:MAG TPA: G1 family glutamic endopeptidase, partial [Acidimicrobiales bacterium]|nr:G1 family glutamic endopeptidase [Acidimicrobiales bacterium]
MRRRPAAVLGRALRSLIPLAVLGVWALAAAATGPAGAGATTAGMLVRPPALLSSEHDDAVTSTNWSGYAVQSPAAFTDVVGTWVEPTGTCALLQPTYASMWVGIDGYGSASVEQLGTDVDCSWTGSPSYYAWWEMYPANSVQLSSSTYPVRPGDTMTAEVKRSGAGYTLSLHSSEG